MRSPPTPALVYYPATWRLWWAFTCDQQVAQLQAPRPLLERDRAELARRREKLRATLEDHVPWIPDKPLATGAEARERLARAQAALQHADPAGAHEGAQQAQHDPQDREASAAETAGPGEVLPHEPGDERDRPEHDGEQEQPNHA